MGKHDSNNFKSLTEPLFGVEIVDPLTSRAVYNQVYADAQTRIATARRRATVGWTVARLIEGNILAIFDTVGCDEPVAVYKELEAIGNKYFDYHETSHALGQSKPSQDSEVKAVLYDARRHYELNSDLYFATAARHALAEGVKISLDASYSGPDRLSDF